MALKLLIFTLLVSYNLWHCLVNTPAHLPSCTSITKGNYLELYYDFNDGLDVAKDSSGNERHGSIKNNAPFVDGKLGKALDFANNANKGSNGLSGMLQAPGLPWVEGQWLYPYGQL